MDQAVVDYKQTFHPISATIVCVVGWFFQPAKSADGHNAEHGS